MTPTPEGVRLVLRALGSESSVVVASGELAGPEMMPVLAFRTCKEMQYSTTW